ncbi:heat shock transcription factor, X-linked member 3-like [Suricata suricatta]|uniref:heat shock transcription factor, X-linked member 3-like n=1 Tax=Suricata suricatta TaxID=37032 RepID=UPI001155B67C|nr:heat shock transcription factor, X-linked member 3-like [Suricata suricatta]
MNLQPPEVEGADLPQRQLSERHAFSAQEYSEERCPYSHHCLARDGATAPKKKRAAAARHKASTKVDEKVPGEAPSAQSPSSSRSFTCSGPGSMSSTAGQALGNGGPRGEGPSRNGTFAPPATAGRDGTDGVVMALNNTCYSSLRVALSVMSPDEAPSENKEQEGPLCVRCEHVKEPPGP